MPDARLRILQAKKETQQLLASSGIATPEVSSPPKLLPRKMDSVPSSPKSVIADLLGDAYIT